MSRTLTLPEMPETAIVKEAREIAAGLTEKPDPALIAWTMKLIYDRDTWFNTRRRSKH